jgi:hypothetical protein
MAQEVVHCGKVEIQLADKGRIKRTGFELDYDEAAQLQMVEKQVDAEILVADFERYLLANKGESGAQFKQESLDVIHQGLLDLPLTARVGGAEEIEEVGILENL